MALRFTTTSKASATHGIKVLTYSRSGIGKTTLCGTAPSPLILSAEAGLLSLADTDVPAIEISTLAELNEAYTFITTSQHAKHFETICMDSATEIAEVILANAKTSVKDPRQAYGELIEQMLKQIKKFRDLPGKHVYVSAKQERFKNDATGSVMFGPGMPGQQLGPGLPYYFDEVFHLDIGQTADGQDYRFLLTQPDFQYEAKDRSGKLERIEKPDLSYIFNKILAKAA